MDVVSDGKYTIHSNGSLSIANIQQEDEGAYRIGISSDAGKATEEIEVVVMQRTG